MANSLALPRLRQDQYKIMSHPAKIKFICAGRRYGKTLMCGAAALGASSAGASVAWIVPRYKNASSFWRSVERLILGISKKAIANKSRATQVLEFANGGILMVYSDANGNADSVLGEAFDLVVIDEAARVRQETFYNVLLPTLADRDGSLIAISTPRGKNWFYDEYQRGLSDMKMQSSFHAPTNQNPSPAIQKAFELARDRVPTRTYQEEWLAIFQDDGGQVFRNVRANVLKLPVDDNGDTIMPVYDPAHTYVIGVDWGQSYDYTVLVVIDMTTGQMVDIDRFNQIAWSVQRGRLIVMIEKWQPDTVLVEDNNMAPFIEALQEDGYNITGFHTSFQSKTDFIQSLALAFEKSDIKILDDPALIAELNQFGMKRIASGWRYEAPAGKHDDTVIALALAYHAATAMSVFDMEFF